MLEILKRDRFRQYYAHIEGERRETLYNHTALVVKYFEKLVKAHNLQEAIENLISGILMNFSESEKRFSKELITSFFYAVPVFHDIGKINPNFQAIKMGNNRFKEVKLSFGSDHSKIGAFLFMQKFLKEIDNKVSKNTVEEKKSLYFILFSFSFVILKHHSPVFEYKNNYKEVFDDNFIKDFLESVKDIKEEFPFLLEEKVQKKVAILFNDILKNHSPKFDPFSLFALLKLNYSLLTAADYYATTHFMQNWRELEEDFGTLGNKLKYKIIKSIKETKSYNKKIYEALNDYKFIFPEKRSNENLNILRQNLAVEVIKNIRRCYNRNLFYIEAPTGGGKTNLSMLAIAELLQKDVEFNLNKVTKIFYVFPFTTLITQTLDVLKETFNLSDNEIVQIHSKSGFVQKQDDKYGEEKLNIIDYQFVNYPIALISHVRFFDILKSNSKTFNYLLHRIANSIVIIDELQAYSPEQWDKIVYFINSYARYFNVKFILMSATLPKIDKLLTRKELQSGFVYLIENKSKYFQNPNFRDRVKIDITMLKEKYDIQDDKNRFFNVLWEKIVDESKKFYVKNKKVHTIVEFIYKKTANEFVNFIGKLENPLFDEIPILSGSIVEPRRKEIICKLKSQQFKDKNILLITTQVVEAGVDIDMDIGFKDKSLIDSDEQLAGRINRNVKKSNCKLFIFDYDNEGVIYGKDERLNVVNPSEYLYIIQNKDFDLLYDKVINNRKNFNQQQAFDDTLSAFINKIKHLKFAEIDNDFRIINPDYNTTTLFIPLKIPIYSDCESEKGNRKFGDPELNFLKEKNMYSDENVVDGERVWKLYCDLVENKEKNFVKKKIEGIILQGIISKFSISIGFYSNQLQKLISSGNVEEKYGFFKVHNVEEVYDYKTGFKEIISENFW